MEKTKASKTSRVTKGKASSAHDKIKAAYTEYLLVHGKQPSSVYKFCLDLGVKEEEFYKHFGSFESLEKVIWNGFMERSVKSLQTDVDFSGFTSREKVLALYFTLSEVLKANRSFILLQLNAFRKPELVPVFLKDFKH